MPAVPASAVRISLSASYKLTLVDAPDSEDDDTYTLPDNVPMEIKADSGPVLIIGTTAAAEIVGFERPQEDDDYRSNPMFTVRKPSDDVREAYTPVNPDPAVFAYPPVGWCTFERN